MNQVINLFDKAKEFEPEGTVYEKNPYDVPEGRKLKYQITEDVRIYMVDDDAPRGAGFLEIFAVHRLWGPSDQARGRRHLTNEAEEIDDAEWVRAAENV